MCVHNIEPVTLSPMTGENVKMKARPVLSRPLVLSEFYCRTGFGEREVVFTSFSFFVCSMGWIIFRVPEELWFFYWSPKVEAFDIAYSREANCSYGMVDNIDKFKTKLLLRKGSQGFLFMTAVTFLLNIILFHFYPGKKENF